MNANRNRIVPERLEDHANSRHYNLTLDACAMLPALAMLLAMLALWPMSLGHGREYTFLTLAALLVIRSSVWFGVEDDESAINAAVEVPGAAPTGFVFF
jgi:ABC-type proline/glycine betaine transport system permease subunit